MYFPTNWRKLYPGTPQWFSWPRSAFTWTGKSMSRPDSTTGKDSFGVANRLFFRLYQCSNLLHKTGTRHMEAFGTTTQQWAVLGALTRPLVREKGMTVKDLIGFLMLSRQNLTAVLDRLEARDWIARVSDPEDGRNRLIRLTTEGNLVWEAMQEPIEAFYSGALAGFSEAEQVQFYQLLDRLRNGLNAI
jgi:DNA-binding MarR family transcriptional regulator